MTSRAPLLAAALAFATAFSLPLAAQSQSPTPTSPTLTVEAAHPVNQLIPDESLGTTVDRLAVGAAQKTMVQPMLGKILAMGLKPISYRQNTELQAEAWHWNPAGTWSDATHQQGYFVGSPTPGEPIDHSWGYTLPDRSTSLVDGKLSTYWKSNPYLAEHYTHEPDNSLPQWVIVDLGSMVPLDAVRIAWANPYATHYAVQYWTAANTSPRYNPTGGIWKAFHSGVITNGHGGTATIKLTPLPVKARYVRILMTASSNTCDDHGSADIRNCVGYAISEVYAGELTPSGQLTDYVQHGARGHASSTRCSSVDPWHRASDLSKTYGEQTGFDYFYKSGITSGLPAMMPIAMVYSNPQTSANEVAWLEARHYPIRYIEMGEEPDGQWVQPEDDAALYIQFADAIHKVDPNVKLGGPVFEGHNRDIETWPDAHGRVSWLGRYVDYLRAHGHLQDLAFVSFEHYPLPCDPDWTSLYREPELIQHVLKVYYADGVPASVPMFVSETNLSAAAGESFETIFGALWEADYVGALFDGGGKATYFFHGIPEPFYGHCGAGGGTFSAINVNRDYQFKGYLSQYFVNQMISEQWAQPGHQVNQVFHVTSNVTNAKDDTVVSAYALHRPDGQWSLLVVNNDKDAAHTVAVAFNRGAGNPSRFTGQVTTVTFGPAQYQWHPATTGEGGLANPDGPAVTATVNAGPESTFTLPAASITVIRGNIH